MSAEDALKQLKQKVVAKRDQDAAELRAAQIADSKKREQQSAILAQWRRIWANPLSSAIDKINNEALHEGPDSIVAEKVGQLNLAGGDPASEGDEMAAIHIVYRHDRETKDRISFHLKAPVSIRVPTIEVRYDQNVERFDLDDRPREEYLLERLLAFANVNQ